MIRLGFHLSIAGAVSNAPKEAASKRYGAFQIFTTSSRSWTNSNIGSSDKDQFIDLIETNNLEPFAHIPYLCNPSSPNKPIYDKSKGMLVNNLNNCNSLGIKYLVIHLGSHLGKGVDHGIENICNALDFALDSTEKGNILLENGSGYNNSVGSKFSEIGEIIDRVDSDRIGICFDTCHAFASGYDMRTDSAVDKMLDDFNNYIELSKLKLIHLNDAKFPLGTGKDRHFHIGKGYIGTDGFVSLFKNKAFGSGSFVMELPEDIDGDHADDMRAIKSIIKKAAE